MIPAGLDKFTLLANAAVVADQFNRLVDGSSRVEALRDHLIRRALEAAEALSKAAPDDARRPAKRKS